MMIFKYKRMDNIKVNIAFRRKNNGFKTICFRSKDWPSAGVSFKDITTIMDNGEHMDMLRIKLLNTQRKKYRYSSWS